MKGFTSIEICAGAGGQALGLEQAGFEHLALVEIDSSACSTLRHNRPAWNIVEADVRDFSAIPYNGKTDLLAGGVPCPPFSIAGKQLGEADERDLFPEAIRLAQECDPKAIMLENVKGLLSVRFKKYRESVAGALADLGYECFWELLISSDYGVPQLRPRAILVALKKEYADFFAWPEKGQVSAPTVGEALYEEMASTGWENVDQWKKYANKIAPTLVGGSKKHGGPDLGPTRARKAWAELGVNGGSLAETPPVNGFDGKPRLTVKMAGIIQGFPDSWQFTGSKTAAYRQVGNAFPPPVSHAVGNSIRNALEKKHICDPKRKAQEINFVNTLFNM